MNIVVGFLIEVSDRAVFHKVFASAGETGMFPSARTLKKRTWF